MRIFYFEPRTGHAGKELEQVALASWTAESLVWAIGRKQVAPIPHAIPTGFGSKSNVTVHIDAGRSTEYAEISYRHETEWRCFCLGEVNAGNDSYWEWVILPPSNLIRRLAA